MSLQVVRQNVSKATFDQHMMHVLLNQASDCPVETVSQMHSILAAGRGEHQFPRRYKPGKRGLHASDLAPVRRFSLVHQPHFNPQRNSSFLPCE